jgi:hypothetical protein
MRSTRQTDNVAGTSDVSSKNETTREQNNSDHTRDSSNSSRDKASHLSNTPRTVLSGSFVYSALTGQNNVQCK